MFRPLLYIVGWLGCAACCCAPADVARAAEPAAAQPPVTQPPVMQWGSLSGRFVYDGPVPERAKLRIEKDQELFGPLDLRDESLIVAEDHSLQNVVVYVRTPHVAIHPDLEKSVPPKLYYTAVGGRYEPHVLTLWVGKQSLIFANRDPVGHNFSFQPLGDGAVCPLLQSGLDFEFPLSRSQVVPNPVSCNIYPWMQGYVLPRSNPYAVVSDSSGRFELVNLPAGELEFQVWHETAGYLALPAWEQGRFRLKIQPGANALGDVKVPAQLFAREK